MTEKPLYEDSQIKVDYLTGSIEDHVLLIKPDGEYIIPRSLLEKFATTSRDDLAGELIALHRLMLYEAREKGLSFKDLGLAIDRAYIEENKRKDAEMIRNVSESNKGFTWR